MRVPLLLISACALLVACLDFILHTVPALRGAAQTRDELHRRHDEDWQRLTEGDIPPTAEALDRFELRAESVEQSARDGRRAWFAGADDPVDYLVRPDRREGIWSDEDALRELQPRLLRLRVDVQSHPGIRLSSLGLADSASELRGQAIRDQAERAACLGWLLECLEAPLEVAGLEAHRVRDGRLRVEFAVVGDPEGVLRFYERFVAPTSSLAPRVDLTSRWERIAADAWSPNVARFGVPPLRLDLGFHLAHPDVAPATETEAEG